MAAFDLSDFKVIEYHPNQGTVQEPSIMIQRDKIVFSISSYTALGNPEHIIYLFSEKNKQLAVQVTKKQTKDTIKLLPVRKSKQFGIYSIPIIQSLRALMTDWSDDKRYRVYGCSYPDEGIMIYDLNKAVALPPTKAGTL